MHKVIINSSLAPFAHSARSIGLIVFHAVIRLKQRLGDA
jgi:hypothetical protein